MRRSPNLDGARVKAIIALVRRMPATPTWQGIVDEVERELGDAYTRQALNAHPPIRAAYEERRDGEPARPGRRRLSSRARAHKDRIDGLVAELAQVKSERDASREVIMRYAYNAFAGGMDLNELEAPLPAIDRTRSIRRGQRDRGA